MYVYKFIGIHACISQYKYQHAQSPTRNELKYLPLVLVFNVYGSKRKVVQQNKTIDAELHVASQ